MNPQLSEDDEIERLRQRVTELECRLEELRLCGSLAAALAAPDAFSWILAEGAGAPVASVTPEVSEPTADLYSVIIPAYNAEAFLARAVESVRVQTLPASRIEIVVADDGSRDGTREIAQHLAAQPGAPLRLVTHPHNANRGVAATRNLACAQARGEFFALLDADDAFLPERLAAADRHLCANPEAAAVCSLGRNVDADGRTVSGHNGTEVAGQWRGLDEALRPPFTFDMLWQVDPVANSSLTIRRQAFFRVGGFPEVMSHQAEDWLLVLKLSLLAPIPCLEQELFLYTHHPGAYTHAYHTGGWRDGARLEVFYHLAHWMLRQADYRDHVATFFRRNFPRVLAAQGRLFGVVRDYCARHGAGAPTLADFEAHVARNLAELESLRRVMQARSRELREWRQEALALRKRLAEPTADKSS